MCGMSETYKMERQNRENEPLFYPIVNQSQLKCYTRQLITMRAKEQTNERASERELIQMRV